MVSLAQRQEVANLASLDPQLERFRKLLDGESVPPGTRDGHDARETILAAISSNNGTLFERVGAEIEARRISPESDWCHDDYLLFLLLAGNEKFGRPLKNLAPIIDARRSNNNPIPRKLNEVFAALNRQEFGIEGEFGFLKIPFLALLGKLHLTVADATKALQAMSHSLNFEQLSPFLQLLTLKAHDIILMERKPMATEDAAQLVAAFEIHARNLSLGQWRQVGWSLPGHFLAAIIISIIGLGFIPVLFGFGTGLAHRFSSPSPLRPEALAVTDITAPQAELPPEVDDIINSRKSALGTAKDSYWLEIECAPFGDPTPAFAVEVSHSAKSIDEAFAFLEDTDKGPRPFTIVPAEKETGRVRLLIPPAPKGRRLCIIVTLRASPKESAEQLAKDIVVRPLE